MNTIPQIQQPIPAEKRCTKCGVVKPLAEFYRARKSRDGRRADCRSCILEGLRRYYAVHKSEVAAKVRIWRKANDEKVNAKKRARYKANPERARARARAWAKANLERKRVWRKANAERLVAYNSAWHKANRERALARIAKRRARKFGVPSVPITAPMKAAMYQDQGGRCFYCREDLNGSYHLEHKIPFDRGGHHMPDNVCLACPPCNLAKGRLTDVEFFARRAEEEKVA